MTEKQRAEIREYIQWLLDEEPEGDRMNHICDAVGWGMIWTDGWREAKAA